MISSFAVRVAACLSIAFAMTGELPAADKTPAIGEKAADFKLKSLAGDTVQLAELLKNGPVVVVALRGYPGYQCPVCSKQLGSFLDKADDFSKTKAQVVFVYPGAAEELKERAKEFIKDREFPKHFRLLLDPDFKFADAYGIRWNEPMETVYPSTFVVDADRTVTFAKISKTHGGRAKVDEVLKAVMEK